CASASRLLSRPLVSCALTLLRVFSFVFFQAEDGIRDHCVTGVQTCALPIWRRRLRLEHERGLARLRPRRPPRSEERRVGEGGRSRWSPYHSKKIHKDVT